MKATAKSRLFWFVAVLSLTAALLTQQAIPMRTFAWGENKLTVVSSPQCGGTVTYYPGLCSAHTYAPNTLVMLTAVPSQGFQFEKWTGDVDGVADTDNSTITVVMSRDRVITVNFTAPEGLYNVTVEASPAAGGFVTVETECGSQTSDHVQPIVSTQRLPGRDVTLLAEPAEGYRFSGWNGDLHSHHDNVTFTVDSSKNITARFAKPAPFPWQWVVLGAGALVAAAAVLVWLADKRGKRKDRSEAKGRAT